MMKRALGVLLAAALIRATPLAADPISVDITRMAGKYNLGIAPFTTGDRAVGDRVVSLAESTIAGDLRFSRLFNLVDKGPVVSKRGDAAEWSRLGSEIVLVCVLRAKGENVEMSARLLDTNSGKEVASFSRRAAPSALVPAAHEISNEVVKYFTGQPGIFASKIAFVNDATGRKELYLADYDGKNVRRLTNDNSIVILPRLSPDGKRVIFTSYRSGNPDLYIMDVDGSNRRKLSAKAGLNVSPAWAPNGQELAVTLSHEGPPNVFLMSSGGAIIRRLTDAQGADTAPCFSPDGAQLAFTSDRAGAPHIYIMNVDGTGLRRMTTASHCDSAAWSPDGQQLLYVKGEARGRFDIYSIEVMTGIERRLTWGEGDNENPSWSPDGRFILFTSSRRKKSELFIMAADGSDPRPLGALNGRSFTPHWAS